MKLADPTFVQTLEPLRAAFEGSGRETIRPAVGSVEPSARAAMDALRGVAAGGLVLGDTLGQGGMGVVRLAEQVALGRYVAVKSLKASASGDGATLALLREAWVTGRLDHPNIVPVHDLGVGEDGSPYLVLKLVEGTDWRSLIHEPAAVRERHGATDVLDWHLRVLMQVCNAVHFAHDRGVLHRDLKPENVMIGAFGEVFVLDWGLALGLGDGLDGRLPLASGKHLLAGTPAYMAPEMLAGGPFDERTDTYLLGGLLYEVLAGRPPHRGEGLEQILEAIQTSAPARPPGPEELVETCLKALAADPADRWPTAEALRRAIAEFLEHRGSLNVLAEARERLTELNRALAEDPPDDERIGHLYAECRFGFRLALRSWPGNTEARLAWTEAATGVARYELGHGDARAAEKVLAEVEPVSAELRQQIAAGIAGQRAREAELARAARTVDPNVGQRTRFFIGLILGVLWTGLPIVSQVYWRGDITYEYGAAYSLAFSVLVVGLAVWARESMSATVMNRSLMAVFLAAPLGELVLWVVAGLAGVDPLHTAILQLPILVACSICGVVLVNWRAWPVAAAYLVAAIAGALHPEDLLLWLAGANAVLLLVSSVVSFPGLARVLDR